jgi:hypothetical protein
MNGKPEEIFLIQLNSQTMKLVKRCLLSLAVFGLTLSANAQDATAVLSKYIDAVGGKEKLAGINSVKYINTMNIMGNEGPATIVVLNGKGFRSDAEVMGSKMVQVFTDKGGWMINPMTGGSDPQALPEDQVKQNQGSIYINPFLDFEARGEKAEYLGQEKVGDVNAYKLKIADKNGSATTYYFDPTTYYLIQSVKSAEIMGQQMEVTTTFSDYRKTDYGWVIPQTMDINMGGQFSMTMKTKNVEVNTPVDASIFEMKK